MANFFTNAILELDRMGVADVILPFILLFAITYAVLSKIKIFDSVENKKGIYTALAFVIGLIPVFQHVLYPNSSFDVIPIINNVLTDVSVVFVAVLLLLILLGIWGITPKHDEKNGLQGVVVLIAVAIIGIIVASEYGLGWYNISRYIDRSTVTIVAALIIFGLIVKFITDDGKPKETSALKDLGGLFEKKE